MIFETEKTCRGVKRKKFHYCENGKKAMLAACEDMGITRQMFYYKQKQILNYLQFNNIIYLH